MLLVARLVRKVTYGCYASIALVSLIVHVCDTVIISYAIAFLNTFVLLISSLTIVLYSLGGGYSYAMVSLCLGFIFYLFNVPKCHFRML